MNQNPLDIFSKRTKEIILADYQKLKEPNHSLRLFHALMPAILLLIFVYEPHIKDEACYLIIFFYVAISFGFGIDKLNKKLDLLAELAAVDQKKE